MLLPWLQGQTLRCESHSENFDERIPDYVQMNDGEKSNLSIAKSYWTINHEKGLDNNLEKKK